MVFNWRLLLLAVLVAVVVGIVLVAFLGPVLVSLKVPIAVTIGEGLTSYGFVIGVIAGLWFYLTGGGGRVA